MIERGLLIRTPFCFFSLQSAPLWARLSISIKLWPPPALRQRSLPQDAQATDCCSVEGVIFTSFCWPIRGTLLCSGVGLSQLIQRSRTQLQGQKPSFALWGQVSSLRILCTGGRRRGELGRGGWEEQSKPHSFTHRMLCIRQIQKFMLNVVFITQRCLLKCGFYFVLATMLSTNINLPLQTSRPLYMLY